MLSKQYTDKFTETSQQPRIISHANPKLNQAQIRTLYFWATNSTHWLPQGNPEDSGKSRKPERSSTRSTQHSNGSNFAFIN
ncbi:hypothetical protein F511_47388 [Dorcoceras hygrometricum]|uniref:Uncharacterized protein n=1 Tax=Dorcoceras hygrometricum TaxID=472368 RepID=A0A2Z6ZXH6_9LAMI|nr:hypothetical protein F511_47388 [Dorcoceras hygrometricum]